jgi:uncharacterized protein YfaS (alpha-2-macroglobulin family)
MKPHTSTPPTKMGWLFLFAAVSILASCGKKKLVNIDPAFSQYIDAYTSGVVSKKTAVRIVLAADASVTHTLNETVKEEMFNFSPNVEGKAYWIDARTIEFKPEKDLKPDELYEVNFNLGKAMEVPSKFKKFKFNIQTIKPSFQVEENGLRAINKETMTLSGQVVTADVEESARVEKVLSASLDGTKLPIKWQHNEANKTHGYLIENIKRGSSAGSIELKWDGSPLNISLSDKKEIAVPAIGDFKVMDIRVVQEEEQYALVQFSDPIMIGQQLEGLISISNQENLSYTILGSEVKLYASNRLEGNYTAFVNEGIQNQWSEKLQKGFSANIYFENRLPSVQIHGKGVILPSSTGKVVLPFEATNLKAVDISIIKVYETNIPQFLQNNRLDGENNLRSVARPLVQATVKLDDDKSLNLHKKNRFMLDLDKYIKTEPGAIYHVHIGFRPAYSLYTCAEMVKAEGRDYYNDYEGEGNDVALDDDDEFWQRYNDYYPYGYDWQQRDNPCSQAYYNRERFASRNIIATNIGLTAKRGSDNKLFVAANDIISTKPLSGVDFQVLDYQQQIIGKASSGSDGIALIDIKRKPYLLVAKKGNEKSYLKLDDGSSLPLSKFDVSGAEVKNGIKGFIFGERGVWRPGDSLFLGFIVEDKNNKLPKNHPIEMELISPKGQLYRRMVATNTEDGFNVFKTATDASAPTGNWLCRMKIGGAIFDKKLKIETVMPNRLKIDLNFNGLTALGKNATVNGTLSAKWLFGATAQNLKARVDAQLYKKQTTFAKYEQFVFDNPTSSFTTQSKTIFDGSLGATGTATINPSFDAGQQPPGMLLANLMVKVFEPGGNFSVDNVSMPYHPYTSYVGVNIPDGDKRYGFLMSGETHHFGIVDVNTNGQLTNGATNVEIQLYKIQWRYWWDNSGDELSNFTQDNYNKLIKTESMALDNGKGIYNLKLNASDYGRYLILIKDTRSGHVTGKTFYVDDYNWQSRSNQSDASAASMLFFKSEKPKYNVGEEVKLTIPTSKDGKALISIETGSKVLKTYWVNTEQGETKFNFKVDKEMTPNIYVNVTLIQPHAQTINDLPIRMYGVVPIEVEDKNTILYPIIKMNDVIRPETNTSITVSEQNSKNMSYVIAIVDEGLLDLTRFKTPDPHEAFYAKEALGVKSWDVYDYVIGAWGGELQRILTIGGDAEAELASKTRKANRFQPIVKFYGPFKSNGSSNTHNFVLPAYMGSVRAMVIAASNGAYGMTEKAVKVKAPLMILPTIPRVVGPEETVRIPISVFVDAKGKSYPSIRFTNNEFLEASSPVQDMSFENGGEGMAYINVKVKNKTGIAKVKIEATLGNEKTKYETEIDVRNPNPPITQVQEFTLQPGQSMNSNVSMIGEGSSSKATLEISSIPAINLQKRLSYLIQYPHGCIEQTTSSVFPQLVLSQLMELNDQRKAEIDRNIRIAIQKIQNFQGSDGGFSYWPGEGPSDEWGSNYAGHFLLEAAAKGYNVPSGMMQQWKAYQRSKALAWNITTAPYYGTDLMQAYRLYLLALAKAPEIGAMNRLKEFKFLTAEGKWRLAAAYHLSGQSQIALQLISGLPTTFTTRPFAGITYGSDVRDEAMILETLTIMNRKGEAEQLVRTVASKLSQDSWYSTQTTAYSLIAIAKYCGTNNANKKINASGKAGSQNVSISSSSTISQNAIAWQSGKADVTLKNNGSNVLYVRVINQGQPLSNQVVPATNNPNVLQVNVSYITTTGAAVDITKLKQGTDFVAKVSIKNPGARGMYNEMALSQIFPSGWEILNTRLYNSEGAFKSSPSEYMDIRDDRVYHYFDIRQNETLTYYVQLNAAYLGKYFWPGVNAEAMYDNTISGGVSGKWVEVVE